MTIYDLIYFIGYGIALLMILSGVMNDNQKEKEPMPFFPILLLSLLFAFLSWGFIIFWIGREIYERKVRK